MAVSDVRTCPKCGQYQMPACMCALRAENAALKESLTWALNELSFRLGKAWAEKDWEHYGPVVTARALLSPQAAELPCPTIEQVEGAYGEAMYEQERETR